MAARRLDESDAAPALGADFGREDQSAAEQRHATTRRGGLGKRLTCCAATAGPGSQQYV